MKVYEDSSTSYAVDVHGTSSYILDDIVEVPLPCETITAESRANVIRARHLPQSAGQRQPGPVRKTVRDPSTKNHQKVKSKQRLPLVKSAPHLNNNVHSLSADVTFQNGAENTNGGAVLPDMEEKINGYKSIDFRKNESKMARARYYIKMSILLACWVFFSIIFILYNEREEIVKHSSVAAGEIKSYLIRKNADNLRVRMNLRGPFLTEHAEQHLNKSDLETRPKMEVWLERWVLNGVYDDNNIKNEDIIHTQPPCFGYDIFTEYGRDRQSLLLRPINPPITPHPPTPSAIRYSIPTQEVDNALVTRACPSVTTNTYTMKTEHWRIVLQDENLIDFTEGETRSNELELKNNITTGSNSTAAYAIRMLASSNCTIPFTISYTKNPLDGNTGVVCACVLLCGLYVLVIFEIVNRTMAAILISMTALAVLSMVGERPSVPEIISWLDIETLLLLFAMMILVSIMAETGMFDFIAVFTFEYTAFTIMLLNDRTYKGQTSMRAIGKKMVTGAHGHPRLQRSHMCVAGLLNRNTLFLKISCRSLLRIPLMNASHQDGAYGVSGERNNDRNQRQFVQEELQIKKKRTLKNLIPSKTCKWNPVKEKTHYKTLGLELETVTSVKTKPQISPNVIVKCTSIPSPVTLIPQKFDHRKGTTD
ncbi:P protein [Eumeta japonica]|uniref:P protein n=1 Tax=Eumeta variegata TaxID=151549 RepID=A0A4C1VYQ1_EUMVA|nr:P protein [Eumeta japonica]